MARAEIDRASASIVLPFDQYRISEKEGDDIASAQYVAMIDCVEQAGLESAEQRRRVIPDSQYGRYGVWLMSEAERYGYVVPELPEKMEVFARNSNSLPMSKAELDQRKKCAKTSAVIKSLNVDNVEVGPWLSELDAAGEAVRKSAEWVDVVDQWQACVAKAGYKADPARFAVAGVDWDAVEKFKVREDDVKRAVVDVACKDETRLVRRLGDLDASAQAPILTKYRAELQQSRAQIDEVLAKAQAVLKEAGL